MRRYNFLCLFVAGLFSVGLFLTASSAHADLVITGASDPQFKTGTKLKNDERLKIPSDITVSIMKLPEQETYVVQGPFEGTLQEYIKIKTCPWLERLIGLCGREDKSEAPKGGVRSIRSILDEKPTPLEEKSNSPKSE